MTRGSLQQTEEQSSTFLDFNLVILFLIHSFVLHKKAEKSLRSFTFFYPLIFWLRHFSKLLLLLFYWKKEFCVAFFYIFMQEGTKNTAVMQNHSSVHEFISSVKISWLSFWVCVEMQFCNCSGHGQTHSTEMYLG